MSEFVEQAGKLGMGGGFVNVAEHPAEEFLDFGAGGLEAGEILNIAPLVAIQGGAEFEQDQALAAGEADFKIAAVFAGIEFLPEPRGKCGEIEAVKGGRFSRGEEIIEEIKGGDEGGFVQLKECLHVRCGCFNRIFRKITFWGNPVIAPERSFRPLAKNNFRNPHKRLIRPFESINTRESLALINFPIPILARSKSWKLRWIVDLTTRHSGASMPSICD